MVLLVMIFVLGTDASFLRKGKVWHRPGASVNNGATILVVPVDSIIVRANDNTRVSPEVLYTDSAMKFAANAFILGYAKQKVSPKVIPLIADTTNKKPSFVWSVFTNPVPDTAVVSFVKNAAASAKADYVVIPCSVTLKQTTYQMEAWRDSPAYQHPVEFSASVIIRVQIWDKAGNLLFERESRGNSGKPALYDAVKHRQKLYDDLERQARRYYAPPPLKALFRAAKSLYSF